ncbi:MAG: 4-alpha-glucanotransferase [Pseudomonadales bacterium]|nr:4-alpha-glucanotransferase [Pseudomonadales bacterium]
MKALNQRGFGILLPVFSLPGGTMDGAESFLEFLSASGASVWQVLPLGPTHEDRSPYLALSSAAGNTGLIGMDLLSQHAGARVENLEAAYEICGERDIQTNDFLQFRQVNAAWLDDYALFSAIRLARHHEKWMAWPAELRNRQSDALTIAWEENQAQVNFEIWCQYIFYRQWEGILASCRQRDIALFGDMPLYVAHDSVDVWCHQQDFQLNDDGSARAVAGVPPDYFAADGQLWGNPLYDWEAMQRNGFSWWVNRLRFQSQLYDIVRIDHFRALESYWEIPADAETARAGCWVRGPGENLLQTLKTSVDVALVAEDLGTITPEVDQLRRQFQLPGIRVLQFGFDGVADNPHNGLNVDPLSVLYTGTHDNDTSVGWYQGLSEEERSRVDDALKTFNRSFPDSLVACLFANHVNLVIVPMQDLLGLDSRARINVPGTTDGNWCWQLPSNWPRRMVEEKLCSLGAEFNR